MTTAMALFMSRGARLAIFAVFAAASFGQNGALAVFSSRVGIVMAVLIRPDAGFVLLCAAKLPFVTEPLLLHGPLH